MIQLERLVGHFQFRLPQIQTPIQLKLWRLHDTDVSKSVRYTQSHFITTTLQIVPFEPCMPVAGSEQEALAKAVGEFLQMYEFAVSRGRTPQEGWLTPNADF